MRLSLMVEASCDVVELGLEVDDEVEGVGHVLVERGVGVLELELGGALLMLERAHGRELLEAVEERLAQR